MSSFVFSHIVNNLKENKSLLRKNLTTHTVGRSMKRREGGRKEG